MDNQAYKTIATGEVGGSINTENLPNISCSKVNIKAVRSNSGNVYIGGVSGLTKVTGGTTSTAGFELDAGEETGWLEIDNLNKLYIICDNAGDDISYIILK